MSCKLYIFPSFEKEVKHLSKRYKSLKADLINLRDELAKNPTMGTDLGGGLRKIRMAEHRIIRYVFIVTSAISAVFGRMEGRIADCCFSPAAKICIPAMPPHYQYGFSCAD